MAGERRREAAGSRPVLEMEVGCGLFYANVKIDNSLLATGTIAGAGVALSVFFYRNPALVEIAVKSAFAGLVDRVQSITLSSVLVYLCFHTKERLLAFMDAFATGTVKQRLEEEFSIIGFKDELEVTVTVYDNASRIRKEMRDGTAFESFESFVGSMESGCITLHKF
ncbi:uncharacterized protein LOC110049185 [Orbicella faveolata]|uniref:uncharacterized protein LOC110049185 n=1 Tax=Orbicella faveolata TaxID=48498 RepID=UPI0009E42F87|nr:uncharacterized protein LOC110049185 [Orbicella faveolata]